MKQHNFNSTRMEGIHVSGRTPISTANSGPFSMPSGISSVQTSASTAAEAPSDFGMSCKNLKREREDSTPVIKEEARFGKSHAVNRTGASSAFQSYCFGSNSVLKGNRPRKIWGTNEHKVNSNGRDMETEVAFQNKRMKLANESGSQMDSFYTRRFNVVGSYKPNGSRDVSQLQMKNMLAEKARKEIRKILDEWNASSVSKNLNKSKNTDTEDREKDKEKAINYVNSNRPRKIWGTNEHKVNSNGRDMETEVAFQNKRMKLANESGSQMDSFYTRRFNAAGSFKPNGSRDVSQLQMKNMLAEKARKEIRKKLNEWNASSVSKNLNKSKNTDTEVREKDKEKAINYVKPGEQEFVDSETIIKKCSSSDSEVPDSLSMSVPRNLELDPAATPMELLQVVTEDELMHKENSREDCLVERCQTTKEEDSDEDIPRKEVVEAPGKKRSRPEILFVYKRKRGRYAVASNC